jgi:putative iron-regulated protein
MKSIAQNLICAAFLALASNATADPLKKSFVENYATILHAKYSDAHSGALALQKAIAALAAKPTAESLDAAKKAWIASRPAYLQTEVARFYGGPIDADETGPEGMINAWPLDENYLDYVEGEPDSGVINDTKKKLGPALFRAMNEKDGEKNISTGYHAIEFLLWGQDLSETGPGARPLEDFTTGKNAARRLQALKTLAQMLTDDLKTLVTAWTPGKKNYRTKFLAKPADEAIGMIVTGMGSLQGGELAGERLSVAYDTKEQEDEHSCFSDTTHTDAIFDAQGIVNIYLGTYTKTDGTKITGPGYYDVVKAKDAALADSLKAEMEATVVAAKAIPVPFDQAIKGADDAPGRKAVKATIDALQKSVATLSKATALVGIKASIDAEGPTAQEKKK